MIAAEGVAPSGVIAVDKPEGPTSHDIVRRARRALDTRRVGHCGTLDPLASGLLLVCVGRLTRLSEWLTGADKQYTATFRLGAVSDTADAQGQIRTVHAGAPSLQQVENAVAKWSGVIEQVPPSHSAIKVDGVRSYERARRDEVVELPARTVTVSRFDVEHYDYPQVRVVVDCTKGTYIRALARDLGETLGCGGYVEALRRTRIGSVDLTAAIALDEIKECVSEYPEKLWIDPLTALRDQMPAVGVDIEGARNFTRGRVVDARDVQTESLSAELPHTSHLSGPPQSSGSTSSGSMSPGATSAAIQSVEVAVCLGNALLGVGQMEDDGLRPTRVLTEPTP
ncbi:MAG TPA: tRNA pseudouridine(55) synthase TruB [Candidatus Latescibacteria bacterium]|nr:tRNA pseudouridine(55) synthase TruB [Candidatus Latescibacterota bacterium]MDP7631457.1 tRNA pseudouridine(55) synthase TruB [Candidatus Latescibacterota bacterium]HJN30084.1 tRNA pseudouridine(55) synthase TruB [Candidatus Latescibacterota bacterium]